MKKCYHCFGNGERCWECGEIENACECGDGMNIGICMTCDGHGTVPGDDELPYDECEECSIFTEEHARMLKVVWRGHRKEPGACDEAWLDMLLGSLGSPQPPPPERRFCESLDSSIVPTFSAEEIRGALDRAYERAPEGPPFELLMEELATPRPSSGGDGRHQ